MKALEGMTFCITGSLTMVRRDFEQLIRMHGGNVSSATSLTGVTHLIKGHRGNDTTKSDNAVSKGIPVVSEDWVRTKVADATAPASPAKKNSTNGASGSAAQSSNRAGSKRKGSGSGSPDRAAKKARLPMCKYGKGCYRKNPDHLAEFRHDDDDDDDDKEEAAAAAAAAAAAKSEEKEEEEDKTEELDDRTLMTQVDLESFVHGWCAFCPYYKEEDTGALVLDIENGHNTLHRLVSARETKDGGGATAGLLTKRVVELTSSDYVRVVRISSLSSFWLIGQCFGTTFLDLLVAVDNCLRRKLRPDTCLPVYDEATGVLYEMEAERVVYTMVASYMTTRDSQALRKHIVSSFESGAGVTPAELIAGPVYCQIESIRHCGVGHPVAPWEVEWGPKEEPPTDKEYPFRPSHLANTLLGPIAAPPMPTSHPGVPAHLLPGSSAGKGDHNGKWHPGTASSLGGTGSRREVSVSSAGKSGDAPDAPTGARQHGTSPAGPGAGSDGDDDDDEDDDPAWPDNTSKQVQGSGAKPYELKRLGPVYSCSCPAWRNQSLSIMVRTCKHLRTIRGDDAETKRCGAAGASVRAAQQQGGGSAAAKAGNKFEVMLAQSWSAGHMGEIVGWWMSEKLDGVRAVWDGKSFWSRNGNQFVAPDWFVKDLPTTATLDGELFGGRGKFQSTVSVVRSGKTHPGWKDIKYCVFDITKSGDMDYVAAATPFEARLDDMNDLLSDAVDGPYCQVVEQIRVKSEDHMLDEVTRITEVLKGEGVMLRMPKSKYENRRTWSLLKVKKFHDAEATVVGHTRGGGRHDGRCGALECRMPDGKTFKIGTGLTDKERENPPKVGSKVTYKYFELTNDGIPRFPVYMRVRPDE